MNKMIIEQVANQLYNDKRYEFKHAEDFRSDAIAWLCEVKNQQRLDELGIGDDYTAVLKWTKQIITYKIWMNYHHKDRKPISLDNQEQYTVDGWLNDNYCAQNDALAFMDEYRDEMNYVLDHLDEDEIELLVNLLMDKSYLDMCNQYDINYPALKMRICRLRKHCKSLYNKALEKLW